MNLTKALLNKRVEEVKEKDLEQLVSVTRFEE